MYCSSFSSDTLYKHSYLKQKNNCDYLVHIDLSYLFLFVIQDSSKCL